MRVWGFMLAFLVIVWARAAPMPFIFVSACVTFRVPSMSLSAILIMWRNSFVDIVWGPLMFWAIK